MRKEMLLILLVLPAVAFAGWYPVNGNDFVIRQITYDDFYSMIGEAGNEGFVKVGYSRYFVPNETTLQGTQIGYSSYPISVRVPVENFVSAVIEVEPDATPTGGTLAVRCVNPALPSLNNSITLNLTGDADWLNYKSKYFEVNPYLWDGDNRDNAIIDCFVKSTQDDVNVYVRTIWAFPQTAQDIIFGRQVFCNLDDYTVIPNAEVDTFCEQNVTLSSLARVNTGFSDLMLSIFGTVRIVIKLLIIAMTIFGLVLLPLWALWQLKRMLFKLSGG